MTTETREAQPTVAADEVRTVALNKPLVIIGMILATALSALDGTIVATAMPTIVGALGGLPLYSLVVSAFLLTATTTVPLYGKLSDMYGRKPVFMFGSGMFIVGSALCGLAWDMPSLIAFRAMQGLGAGAVLPVSLTLIGDLFDIEERARIQGVFGSVWGVSGIMGPLVGGAIVQFFDWRWVFFINVPIGIISALLLFLYLREPPVHTQQRVDVAGAVTLTFGIGLLMMALQTGGNTGRWLSPEVLGLWVGAAALLVLFGAIERRAAAPILSLSFLTRPVIGIPCLVGLLAGAVLIGIVTFVPLLVQGAWGGSPIEAGLIIAPLSIGWPLASAASGRLVKLLSYRKVAIAGMLVLVVGALLLLTVRLPPVASDPLLRTVIVAGASLVAGVGLGLNSTSMLIALQVSVPWSERGIGTASFQFFRNMGNAVGAAVLGALLTVTLAGSLADAGVRALIAQMPDELLKAGADPGLGPVNVLFDLKSREMLAPDVRTALANALSGGLWWVYLAVAVFAIAAAIIVTRFPATVAIPGDSTRPPQADLTNG